MASQHRQINHQEELIGGHVVTDGISDLLKMLPRVKTVEKAMIEEMDRLEAEKATVEKEKLEMREKVKLRRRASRGDSFHRNEIMPENEPTDSAKLQKNKPEISEVKNGILMKDIQLDQVSGGSSRRRSKREIGRADDQMLELWESAEKDNMLGPAAPHARNHGALQLENTSMRNQSKGARQKSPVPSSESQIEKEVGIDKLEVPANIIAKQPNKERNRGKILERLASDAQKLASLYTSVQDMKNKVEMKKRSKKANDNDVEFEKVKRQIQEVEEAVVQLAEANDQLRKDVGERPASPEGNNFVSSEEMSKAERNGVTEEARKGSEKIGRLQIEVQSIQYILLKLEDENKSKNTPIFYGSRTGILLRDFINNGRRRSIRRRKKACFCGCARPSTIED